MAVDQQEDKGQDQQGGQGERQDPKAQDGKSQDDKGQEQKGSDQQGQNGKKDDEEAKKKADPRRKRTFRLIILAVLVVAVIVAIPVYAYVSVRESTDDAQVDGHVIFISPRISGTVLDVLVNDNQPVSAGQELVRLDPADYQVSLQQAQAQLVESQASTNQSRADVPITTINTVSSVRTNTAGVDQAQAGVNSSQQAINVARAGLASSQAMLAEREANYIKAQKDLVRMRDLVDKDEISHQDFDAAVASADANRAQVDSAKAGVLQSERNVDQAVAGLDESKARLASALVQRRQSEQSLIHQQEESRARFAQSQATIKQRQASLDQAQLNMQYTLIKAPVDGVVSSKTAEPGMQLSAGQQIMALVPLDDVWITANFKETQLRHMRVGQRVEIEVDTYGSSRRYRAHVDSLAAASGAKFSLLPPENATGNYVKVVQRIPVKIVLEPGENRDHSLLPGMSVVPTVLLNSGTNNAS